MLPHQSSMILLRSAIHTSTRTATSNLVFQYLAQGHFKHGAGAGDPTLDLLVNGNTTLPPEAHPGQSWEGQPLKFLIRPGSHQGSRFVPKLLNGL